MRWLPSGDSAGCGIAGAVAATSGVTAGDGLAGGMLSPLLRRYCPALLSAIDNALAASGLVFAALSESGRWASALWRSWPDSLCHGGLGAIFVGLANADLEDVMLLALRLYVCYFARWLAVDGVVAGDGALEARGGAGDAVVAFVAIVPRYLSA